MHPQNGLPYIFYAVKRANTERLKKYSIPYMQNLFNVDNKKRKMELKDLNDHLNLSKKRKFS